MDNAFSYDALRDGTGEWRERTGPKKSNISRSIKQMNEHLAANTRMGAGRGATRGDGHEGEDVHTESENDPVRQR